jgi:DNA-binding transcriptional regulator YiaG
VSKPRRADTKALLAQVKSNIATIRGQLPAHEQNPVDVKALRARLDLSQSEFASRFGFSVRTLQDWELGRTQPAGPARAYLTVIDRLPGAVSAALRKTK